MMNRLTVVLIGVLCGGATIGCGKDSGTNPSGNSGAGPRLRVTYAGFVGQSFTASPPTLCPTAACSVTPAQTVTSEGTYNYTVADGSTYVLEGTLVGRPAPLGPPAANVGSALSFSLGWEPAPVARLFGIQRSSVRLFLNGVEVPSQNIFNGPGCGHYLETLITPSVTTRWSFIFTVISYLATVPPGLCA
jgi:hypothetical protein